MLEALIFDSASQANSPSQRVVLWRNDGDGVLPYYLMFPCGLSDMIPPGDVVRYLHFPTRHIVLEGASAWMCSDDLVKRCSGLMYPLMEVKCRIPSVYVYYYTSRGLASV